MMEVINNTQPIGFARRTRLFMDDQGQRIENKIDSLSQLVFRELGASPLRAEAVTTLQGEVSRLMKDLNEMQGAIRMLKWMSVLFGGGGLVAGTGLGASKLLPLLGLFGGV
jgi:UDP-N-acetylglucosamine:LPS N-acetylglucosamine transferase